MQKAFLSSTYEDLSEHRKRAMQTLQRLGVPFEAMELFGSHTERPVDVALARLERCDFYIGILGMRYGSIDEASEISMTEAEYRRAQELGMNSRMYLIDEKKHLMAPAHVETGHSAEQLRSLKTEIKARHTVSFFSSEHELAWLIATDLATLRLGMAGGGGPPHPAPTVVEPEPVEEETRVPEPVAIPDEKQDTGRGSVSLAISVRDASEDESPDIKSTAHVVVGAEVIADVLILPPGVVDSALQGFQFDFVWDPDVLLVRGIDDKIMLSRAKDATLISFTSETPSTSGRITSAVADFGPNSVDGHGVLARLHLRALRLGDTGIELSNVILAVGDAPEIPVREVTGAVVSVTEA